MAQWWSEAKNCIMQQTRLSRVAESILQFLVSGLSGNSLPLKSLPGQLSVSAATGLTDLNLSSMQSQALQCTLCGKIHLNPEMHYAHVEKCSRKSLRCDICGHRTMYPSWLKAHMKTHEKLWSSGIETVLWLTWRLMRNYDVLALKLWPGNACVLFLCIILVYLWMCWNTVSWILTVVKRKLCSHSIITLIDIIC